MDILAGRENALISVIIPLYNTAQYLREAVESVLRQTYTNWEMILVDDGSTDGSGAICDEYAGKDARIHVIHTENRGVSCARNAGLDVARGEWICFIDSDDWVEENALAYLLENASDADVVMCARPINENAEEYWKIQQKTIIDLRTAAEDDLLKMYLCRFELCVWGKLYRHEKLTGRFREGVSWAEDAFFNLEHMELWKKIALLPESIYNYRKREDSLSSEVSFDRMQMYRDSFDAYSKVYAGCKRALQLRSKVFVDEMRWYFFYYIWGNNPEMQKKMLIQLWLEDEGFDFSRIHQDELDDRERIFWQLVLNKDADAIYQMMMDMKAEREAKQ